MKKGLVALLMLVVSVITYAQTTITGNVFDIYLEPIPGINVSSKKASTTTDFDGTFVLKTEESLPLTITVSGVGFQTQSIEATSLDEVSIVLEKQSKLQEVIVSASRTPERVLESPVSVERFGSSDIKNSTGYNFYESLVNLKGIDVLHNNYNVKNVVSNRGFANTENTRFVQLVDGVETTLPFINYSMGNTMGVNDLDIKNVEILPGAASALYGPNAFNGIMLMTSKSPFTDEGVSTYIKGGVTSQEAAGSNPTFDFGLRLAKAFSKKVAAKVNFSYGTGEDWYATDYRNTTEQGGVVIDGTSHLDAVNYDGLNVYGDEIDTNVVQLALVFADYSDVTGDVNPNLPITYADISQYASNQRVSRVGFAERDLIDYGTQSLRFDGSFHYRPFGNEDLELEVGAKLNSLDNIIHGYNRYSQKGGFTQQYRALVNGKNFFVRGYYTKNKAELVDTRLLGIYVNKSFKSELDFFTDFVGGYAFALQFNPEVDPFQAGFANAEEGKPEVGSTQFNTWVNQGKTISIQDGGALLTDESAFYHLDANYNFRDIINFIDFQVGGSYRDYELNSGGDIYSDAEEGIFTKEFGIYAQAQKSLFDDHLKLSVTARYDKSDNFDANISPRASIAYAIGDSKNHNIRFSYQTGFRNPTTQDQYANMNLGDRRIVGTVQDNLENVSHFYGANSVSGSLVIPEGVSINEDMILNNSYTESSVEAFKDAAFESVLAGDAFQDVILNNASILQKADLGYIEPEKVQTFELGYRGAVNISENLFEFDVAAFYNIYENFLTHKSIVVPFYGDVSLPIESNLLPGQAILYTDAEEYILRTNTSAVINSYGLNIGFTTQVFGDYNFGMSYALSKFEDDGTDTEFNPEYNTPENVIKLSFGNEKLFRNFGFRTDLRWQSEYLYQSVFIQDVVDARTVLDAQINYTIPKMKSRFKLGATNLFGKDYISVPGAGAIGSQYYLNWTINN